VSSSNVEVLCRLSAVYARIKVHSGNCKSYCYVGCNAVTTEINLTTSRSNCAVSLYRVQDSTPEVDGVDVSLPSVSIMHTTRNHVPAQSRLHLYVFLLVNFNRYCIN
jgi:hypothetical protein